jgi:hypothetical protein
MSSTWDVNYFDTNNVGYVHTATEVSYDNSALSHNIRKNENALQGALCDMSVVLDDNIVKGTALGRSDRT